MTVPCHFTTSIRFAEEQRTQQAPGCCVECRHTACEREPECVSGSELQGPGRCSFRSGTSVQRRRPKKSERKWDQGTILTKSDAQFTEWIGLLFSAGPENDYLECREECLSPPVECIVNMRLDKSSNGQAGVAFY